MIATGLVQFISGDCSCSCHSSILAVWCQFSWRDAWSNSKLIVYAGLTKERWVLREWSPHLVVALRLVVLVLSESWNSRTLCPIIVRLSRSRLCESEWTKPNTNWPGIGISRRRSNHSRPISPIIRGNNSWITSIRSKRVAAAKAVFDAGTHLHNLQNRQCLINRRDGLNGSATIVGSALIST